MRTEKYSCPNGCTLPPRKKVLTEFDNHQYGFDYVDYTYCPICGSLMPNTKKKIEAFFEIYHIHPKLKNAERLIYKSEYVSAAREAFVAVESVLKRKSGLDLHGFDLATKALKFEVDKQTGDIIKQPLIAINDLKTESERNEQDGVRYMLMGFFQGVRNLYQHNHIGSGVSNVLAIVIDASFFLNLLDGHSILKNGRWLPSEIDYRELYQNTPKKMDRIKLLHMLKKRQRLQIEEIKGKKGDDRWHGRRRKNRP